MCSQVISPSRSWGAPEMTPLLARLDCVMFPRSPMLLFSRSVHWRDVSRLQRDVHSYCDCSPLIVSSISVSVRLWPVTPTS